jgi:hypothetical protein
MDYLSRQINPKLDGRVLPNQTLERTGDGLGRLKTGSGSAGRSMPGR